jgi:transposase-like protein
MSKPRCQYTREFKLAAVKLITEQGRSVAEAARSLGGGGKTGPSSTDRGRKGSKHHAVVDGHGIPLAATVSAANAPDATRQRRGAVQTLAGASG